MDHDGRRREPGRTKRTAIVAAVALVALWGDGLVSGGARADGAGCADGVAPARTSVTVTTVAALYHFAAMDDMDVYVDPSGGDAGVYRLDPALGPATNCTGSDAGVLRIGRNTVVRSSLELELHHGVPTGEVLVAGAIIDGGGLGSTGPDGSFVILGDGSRFSRLTLDGGGAFRFGISIPPGDSGRFAVVSRCKITASIIGVKVHAETGARTRGTVRSCWVTGNFGHGVSAVAIGGVAAPVDDASVTARLITNRIEDNGFSGANLDGGLGGTRSHVVATLVGNDIGHHDGAAVYAHLEENPDAFGQCNPGMGGDPPVGNTLEFSILGGQLGRNDGVRSGAGILIVNGEDRDGQSTTSIEDNVIRGEVRGVTFVDTEAVVEFDVDPNVSGSGNVATLLMRWNRQLGDEEGVLRVAENTELSSLFVEGTQRFFEWSNRNISGDGVAFTGD